MTLIIPQHSLFYAAVPKIACTTLKHFFYTAQTGEIFDPNVQGKTLHQVWPGLFFDDYPETAKAMDHRITIVRNPLKRFLSAYQNRVHHHGELSQAKAGNRLKELDLKPDPSLDEFIDHLDLYRKAHSSIAHHTQPMTDFLGQDPTYFTHIYNMQQLEEMAADINAIMGTSVTLPHLQRTHRAKLQPDDLSETQRRKLRNFYAKDFEIFTDYLGK